MNNKYLEINGVVKKWINKTCVFISLSISFCASFFIIYLFIPGTLFTSLPPWERFTLIDAS